MHNFSFRAFTAGILAEYGVTAIKLEADQYDNWFNGNSNYKTGISYEDFNTADILQDFYSYQAKEDYSGGYGFNSYETAYDGFNVYQEGPFETYSTSWTPDYDFDSYSFHDF